MRYKYILIKRLVNKVMSQQWSRGNMFKPQPTEEDINKTTKEIIETIEGRL